MKKLPLHRRPYFAKRVLEIGGGHSPYAGITHAVDKYPDDNFHRAADLRIPEGVEFRQGELESIPFGSEERFDFIYLSHVFEHVKDPAKAVFEINRVCSAGYLETPSPLREQIARPNDSASEHDIHQLFCWASTDPDSVHAIFKNSQTIAKFCDCDSGKLARELADRARAGKLDIEPLLPRGAKTTRLHFRTPLRLQLHPDFDSACRAGFCAYRSSMRTARYWTAAPQRWLFKRFAKLNEFLNPCT